MPFFKAKFITVLPTPCRSRSSVVQTQSHAEQKEEAISTFPITASEAATRSGTKASAAAILKLGGRDPDAAAQNTQLCNSKCTDIAEPTLSAPEIRMQKLVAAVSLSDAVFEKLSTPLSPYRITWL